MGIKIYLQNGQLKLDMPWTVESIPDPARYILRELKRRQAEVLAHLEKQKAELKAQFALSGLGAEFVLAQRDCYERGHCRMFEFDCSRFPVTLWGTWL